MKLTEFLSLYTEYHEFGVRKTTVDVWYRPAIADFQRFMGKDPELVDLSIENFNKWIAWKQAAGSPAATIRTRRNAILALWRAAFERDLTNVQPVRVRKIRVPHKPVEAWTRAEMKGLLAFISEQMPDRLLANDLSKRLYFRSLVLSAWDTGMRLGDLLRLERRWIVPTAEGGGRITLLQSKTHRPVYCHFAASTMVNVDALMAQGTSRELIWPLWCRREHFYKNFRGIVASSKVRKGTFRWIRRASATAVELEQPGQGYKHAGHSDPGVTNRHYIDRSQFDGQVGPTPLAG